MRKKIKQAFDQVQAEDSLKNSTREYIMRKTNGYAQAKAVNYKRLLPAAACALLLLVGSGRLYFTPTVRISIDINPSMELGVNRFDRVVSVEGYNDDGKDLTKELNVKFMDYREAVDQIIANSEVEALLSQDEIMTISVAGKSEVQSTEVFSGVENCTKSQRNTHCYYASSEEVEKAHEAGLSYGKYRAFLELKELAPDMTAEDVQDMSMREIRDMIEELSGNESDSFSQSGGKLKQEGQSSQGKNQKGNHSQGQETNFHNGNSAGSEENRNPADNLGYGKNQKENHSLGQGNSPYNGNSSGNGENGNQAENSGYGKNYQENHSMGQGKSSHSGNSSGKGKNRN